MSQLINGESRPDEADSFGACQACGIVQGALTHIMRQESLAIAIDTAVAELQRNSVGASDFEADTVRLALAAARIARESANSIRDSVTLYRRGCHGTARNSIRRNGEVATITYTCQSPNQSMFDEDS